MDKQVVMELLQYKRHELMNHLQMVQGYIHLDKKDAALEKVSAIVHEENQERKLFHLDIPIFSWWLLLFPLKYPNLRLKYEIHTQSTKLNHVDQILYQRTKEIMETIMDFLDDTQAYEIKLQLLEKEKSDMVINIVFYGNFGHVCKNMFDNNGITYWLNEMKDKMMARFTVAINKKV